MLKALFFDLFGTVVDWRNSVIKQLEKKNFFVKDKINLEEFVINWRLKYLPILKKVNNKDISWKKLDELHLIILNEVCHEMKIKPLSENDKLVILDFWHKLNPWPDSSSAINQLNKNFITATLSNGNIALQKDLLSYGNLNFDFIFSAEHFYKYKPHKVVYTGAVKHLNLKPHECALIASHKNDLLAASKCGLKTIYISRPKEYGAFKNKFVESNFTADINVNSLKQIRTHLIKKF